MTVEEVQQVIDKGGFLYCKFDNGELLFAPKAMGSQGFMYGVTFRIGDRFFPQRVIKGDFLGITDSWREATQEEIEKWVPIEYRIDKTSNQN